MGYATIEVIEPVQAVAEPAPQAAAPLLAQRPSEQARRASQALRSLELGESREAR